MIKLSDYYHFAADQIDCIRRSKETEEYPYTLTVVLRSGKEYSVNYKNEFQRDRDADRMAKEVDFALRDYDQQILSKLYLIHDTVKRVDRRGLRIWRQLKQLLGVEVEEETYGKEN